MKIRLATAAATFALTSAAHATPANVMSHDSATARQVVEQVAFRPALRCLQQPICRAAAEEALKRLVAALWKRATETSDRIGDLFPVVNDPAAMLHFIERIETALARDDRLSARLAADIALLKAALNH